jgi:NADH-quinone oxidoreductase subunit G
MNRCIQCYRCVRFYRDYAGGRDLHAFACHDHVYFGRHEDGTLESPFAGNLVEVCPTGVFTDKTLARHYVRKWDLQTAPSICIHCSLGCNTIPGERYGTLRRIRNRYNGEVNGYFLCDRGRYGYEFVNSDRRLRSILRKKDDDPSLTEVNDGDILAYLASLYASGKGVIGIGSPRASLEANLALRMLVGEKAFYSGASPKDESLVSMILQLLLNGPARTPTLSETASADAVLVLGEDVTNCAPVMSLNLIQASRQKSMDILKGLKIDYWDDGAVRAATQGMKGDLFVVAPYRTDLDRFAAGAYRCAPDDIAAFGFEVACRIDRDLPSPDLSGELKVAAGAIADRLRKSRQPLIVSGTGCRHGPVIRAAAEIARALCRNGRNAWLSYIVPECNSLGLAMLGGLPLTKAFDAAGEGKVGVVVVLENDLYTRAEAGLVDKFVGSVENLIVLDHFFTPTVWKARVALPSSAWVETDGTIVNNEGRAQRFFKVFSPSAPVREGWRWLRDLMIACRHPEGENFRNFDDLVNALSGVSEIMKPVIGAAPASTYRFAGMKVARQHYRFSGRTAVHADKMVHEPVPPDDRESPLAFSMEGYQGAPSSALLARVWTPGWNSVQSVNRFQSEVKGSLRGGDPGKRLIDADVPSFGAKVEGDTFPGADPYRRDEPESGPVSEGNRLLLVPSYEVFGSEELSSCAPAVAARVPKPYIGMNRADIESAGIDEGEDVLMTVNGVGYTIRVCVKEGVPRGVAALAKGLPGSPVIDFPAYARVRKA